MIDPTHRSPGAHDGVIERTADGGTIHFERHLPYDVRDVWSAITEPERLADWWLPFDADITVDLRERGEMRFAGRGEGDPDFTFAILRVEAPLLLEHTHADPSSLMRWELEPTATGCTLRVTHHVTDADAAIEGCYVVGLHHSLDRLEPTLAGTPAPWDWDEFAEARAAYARLGFASEGDAS